MPPAPNARHPTREGWVARAAADLRCNRARFERYDRSIVLFMGETAGDRFIFFVDEDPGTGDTGCPVRWPSRRISPPRTPLLANRPAARAARSERRRAWPATPGPPWPPASPSSATARRSSRSPVSAARSISGFVTSRRRIAPVLCRLIKRVLTKQATAPGVPGERPGPPDGRDGRSRLIVPDRSSEGPERMLKDFRSGFLQSDAYSAYDQIHARGILEVGCMAHARRKTRR